MADEAAVATTIQTPSEAGAATSTSPVQETSYEGGLPDIGDMDISEAALRGETPVVPETPATPPAEEPATPAEPTTPATEEQPAASEPSGKEGEEAKGDQDAAPENEKPQKPPKGFVPTAAVQEARRENAALKAQIQALMQAQAEPPAPPADDSPWKDFKELTQPELAALVTEDPAAAVLYTTQLVGFKEHQRQIEAKATQANAVKALEGTMVNAAYTRMAAAVPELFTEGSTAGQELAEFAAEIGFGPDLFPLTDPNVRIILPGESKPTLLGEGAAALVEMLAQLRGKMQTRDTEETALRERLTKEITEKVQVELLEKFKSQAPGFTTLASLPGTQAESGADPLQNRVLTIEEIANLSEKEMERYLAGA